MVGKLTAAPPLTLTLAVVSLLCKLTWPANVFKTPFTSFTVIVTVCAVPAVTVVGKSRVNWHGPEDGQTVKLAGELLVPPTETTTLAGPVGTVEGTSTVIDVSDHTEAAAAGVLPNTTVLVLA